MDLALNDDQRMLVESVDALLDKKSGPPAVRAAEPLGFDPTLWDAVGELGLVQMAVPEASGGWGASMLDMCLVAESLGRHCAPAPVVETQVSARLLARLAAADRLEALLGRGAVGTLALHDPVGPTARLVPAGAVADVVLVRRDRTVLALAGRAPHVDNHANLPLADVALDNPQAVDDGASADDAFDAAVDEWLLLTAASLVGLSASALRLATDYARERRAFGSPIGAFQGIAHRLADMATAIDGARLLVHEAAWSTDEGLPEAGERQCMAFAFAADVARQATYWSMHTLGGYGVMLEYDTQLYFRRARGWAGVFGDPEAAYRRVARHRYAGKEVPA